MRQAIEENFILDVLRGYTTYQTFFGLVKEVAEDPELDKRKAASALGRFMSLHPHNIAQKVEVIVEHFRQCVAPLLQGQGEGDGGDRLAPPRGALQAGHRSGTCGEGLQGHSCMPLVAFSGEVVDPDLPGVSYTEVGMNSRHPEAELRKRFDTDAYNVLVVANKYQTGFDQPQAGGDVRRQAAVRDPGGADACRASTAPIPGKESTFVLDFVNEREEILHELPGLLRGGNGRRAGQPATALRAEARARRPALVYEQAGGRPLRRPSSSSCPRSARSRTTRR